ncbi:unnamed protein product [Macrosiphum euphorbiae]|uniref:PiggyBac transposable element-derived protein domain-containing protein n=1 Tax=Macrosiphum euphorbiae TaxID=13131 RepID=A0AAV0VWE7_9HEMI|nr:unnamed protein product [Macrosiphum euphorbiae]
MYSNGVLVGKWKDKRDVLYISTEFKNNLILAKNKKDREELKPEPIANYNKFMGGIDRQDQMVQMNSYYPFLRKTIRWYEKIGMHVIQMLLLNSYNLYSQSQVGSKLPLYDFRLYILSGLLPAYPKPRLDKKARKKHIPKTHKIGKNGKTPRKRCCVSAEKKIRKDTSYFCPICPNHPSICLEPCFVKCHHNKYVFFVYLKIIR